MDINNFETIQPFVRMVKIKKTFRFEGGYEDFDHVMVYIKQGTVIYNTAGIPYRMEAGDALLMPPYFYHYLISASDDILIQYIIHFDLASDPSREGLPHQSSLEMDPKPELPSSEKLFHDTVYKVTIPPEERFQFESLYLQMYQEFSHAKAGYRTMLRCMATQYIFSFLRCISDQSTNHAEKPEKVSKPWKLVQSALEYIWLHYSEDLGNTAIARIINISPNYLSKIFHQYTGTSMHKYITSYRLKQARQMLMTGEYNITEVAQKCGFSSIHIFSKLFKKEYNVNPSAYIALPNETTADQPDTYDYDPNQQTFYNL